VQALEQYLSASFRRCREDGLGNRRGVGALVRQTLGLGLSVCMDRTNFEGCSVSLDFSPCDIREDLGVFRRRQRAHWMRIARDLSVPVWVLVSDVPVEACTNISLFLL
jgi:hypothetical protein